MRGPLSAERLEACAAASRASPATPRADGPQQGAAVMFRGGGKDQGETPGREACGGGARLERRPCLALDRETPGVL